MRKVIDRGLQVGAFCIERTRTLLEFLHLALSSEIHLTDPLSLGAQLREAFLVANAIAGGQRGFEFSPDRGEFGLELFEKAAFEFFNEGAGAFALESPVNRLTLERRKRFARLRESGTRRIHFAFAFDTSRLELLDRGFELAMSRGRGFALCDKTFQFTIKFDAFGASTLKLRAMLLDLRFEFRGELAQMAMFLLESTERGLACLNPGAHIEHLGAQIPHRSLVFLDVADSFGNACPRVLLRTRKLLKPYIGRGHECAEFADSTLGVGAFRFGEREPLLPERNGRSRCRSGALGLRRTPPRRFEFLLDAPMRRALLLEAKRECFVLGFGLCEGEPRGFNRRPAVLKIVLGAVASMLAAAAAYNTVGPQEVAFARDEDSAVAVEVRRRQRGAQVLGHHHMAQQRLRELNIARLDLDHVKQAAENPGRLNRRMCCTRCH